MNNFRFVLLTVILYACMPAQAQRITDGGLKTIVKSTITAYEKKPVEKLYVQTDKSGYFPDDTIRFKAYLLNGDFLGSSVLSSILYVELANEAGKIAKRMMLPVGDGLAWADLPLDTADVKQGNYTLRAYTNWMRNFGDDYIFKKNITISRRTDNPLLVNSLFKQTGNKVEGSLQLKKLDGKLQWFKDIEVKLMSGKKNLSKDKMTTGIDGRLTFNFTLPENNEPITIKLASAGSGEVTVPFPLNRLENIDVQFMPEGGQLVAGLESKVGIKAIGEDGKGINVSGKVLNSKGDEVASINTLQKGMGSFAFTPIAGEIYMAKINGINKTFALPSIKQTGTALSVISTNTQSWSITINAAGKGEIYYLIGQARGVVCYAEPVDPLNGAVNKSVAKTLFPTGIVRFTLIGADQKPVNERIVFVNHQDNFRFNIQPDKNSYASRDSIALSLQVTDKTGKPVQGNFSMAVTDNSQVKIDSLGGNILTNLLLTSDLKGEIEQPYYYFTSNKEAELDNLMLTQGWVGYDWKEILSPETKPIPYHPEKEYVISGTVNNAFGKPIERSPISLMSKNPLVFADTLSDKNGRFFFKDILPIDTAIFKLQARNKNKKEFNVAIKMDEQSFPVFKPASSSVITPWYVNTDTTLLNNAAGRTAEEKAKDKFKGIGTVLSEVNIKAKKIVKGSHNLNGPGKADLILDEKEMLKAGKKTLRELLLEKIPGILEIGIWTKCYGPSSECKITWPYVVDGKKIGLVIDGLNIETFYYPIGVGNPYTEWKSYIDGYLNYYTAEDVIGMELMLNTKYNMAYTSATFGTTAHIEITTRTGHGPFMKVTPGTYLYKPLAFTLPKQFYSPKYNVNTKNIAPGTDMRSTIFWEPNIVTDAAGKATVSFYTADKPVDYSVIIEGTDMSGGLGFGKTQIKSAK